MSPDHAFAVVAYGESPFLSACLRSLTAQTSPSRIVVATSTPNSLIEGLARAHAARLEVNPLREGIGQDWNFALEAADADLVTLAHQDDIYHPGFAQASLEALDRAEADLCFTGYQQIDDDGRPASSKISRVQHLIEALALGGARQPGRARMRAFLAFGNPLPCSSVTLDRRRLPHFRFSQAYASNLDWDAWLRLLEAGARFARSPERLVGRRRNALTETSRLIRDGRRQAEDLEMFRRLWPRPFSDLIAAAYRLGY